MAIWCVATGGGLVLCGCMGDARVDLSAADALGAVANEMDAVVAEYHEEVGQFDDLRESEVVAAFVERTRRDASDEAAMDRHVEQFTQALQKIRKDRETELARRQAARQNTRVLREVATGLRRLAIESLTLDDEVRRYLTGWLNVRRTAREARNDEENGHE